MIKRSALLLFLLPSFVGAMRAQVEIDGVPLPQFAAVEAFAGLLEVIRGEDESACESGVDELWSKQAIRQIGQERIAGSMRMWRERHREAVLVELRDATDEHVVGVMQDPTTEQYFALVVDLEAQETEGIRNAHIGPSSSPLAVARRSLTAEQAQKEVSELVQRLAALELFSGVVLLARGDEPVVRVACGRVSRRYAEVVTDQTMFNIGSITKMCTAIAVLQLAERGRLDLSDPIGKYLDDTWVTEEVGKSVCIEHLLRHTGGVGNFIEHPEYATTPRTELRSLDDLLRFCRVDELDQTPGGPFSYSNTGFVLLGKIVALVTGGPYEDYMQRAIYTPLGMRATGCFDWDRPPGPMAEGFYPAPDPDGGTHGQVWCSNVFLMRARGCPAGGSFSTAPDLLALGRGLLSARILSRESVARLRMPKTGTGSAAYGLGCQVFTRSRWIPGFGHSGGAPGVRAHLVAFPEHDLTLVLLSNYGHGYDAVFEKCMRVATGLSGGWRGD